MTSKGFMFKHVKNLPDLPTEQLKSKLSHLGHSVNMKIENWLWTASFHIVNKNEPTCSEEGTIRRSKEPTTASGKAESTEEATGYVNDLDVSVTTMLLLSYGQLQRMEQERVSILDQRWTTGKVQV